MAHTERDRHTDRQTDTDTRRERVSWCFTPSQPVRLYQGDREWETDRQRQRDRDRQREGGRQTDRQTQTQADRDKRRQKDRGIERQRQRETETETQSIPPNWLPAETDRQITLKKIMIDHFRQTTQTVKQAVREDVLE